MGRPSEAHQFEHGTTRRVATPTLLENKMPLLGPSSAFLTSSILPLVKRLSLANLHRVSPITGERWATTLPPPSVPRAGILAPRCRARRCQSSLIPTEDVIASLSLPALRRMVCWNCPQREGSRQGKPSYRFGYGVSASFAILGLRRFRRRFLSSA